MAKHQEWLKRVRVHKVTRNHYNVKLLRGYGISINLKDNKINLKNGVDSIGLHANNFQCYKNTDGTFSIQYDQT